MDNKELKNNVDTVSMWEVNPYKPSIDKELYITDLC